MYGQRLARGRAETPVCVATRASVFPFSFFIFALTSEMVLVVPLKHVIISLFLNVTAFQHLSLGQHNLSDGIFLVFLEPLSICLRVNSSADGETEGVASAYLGDFSSAQRQPHPL